MAPIATSVVTSSTAFIPAITTPLKSLLRHTPITGTVRTRDEAELDLDDGIMSATPRPSKRAKTVTFNPLVQEQIFYSNSDFEGGSEAVRVEVRRALEAHIRGEGDEAYDSLKEIFAKATRSVSRVSEDASSADELKTRLWALTSCVSLLSKNCSGLVSAVLSCEWLGRDENFVKAYAQFLGNLASAQGSYVGPVLEMLVGKFNGSKLALKSCFLWDPTDPSQVRMSSGRLPSYPIVSREQMFSRVHMALKYLLRLIPSASGTLAPTLANKFPYSDDSKKEHMIYIENLTRLIQYAPELRGEIYALITEKLVKIDVQMQTDLDDLDDEVSAAIVQAISLQSGRVIGEADEDEESDSDDDSVTSDDLDADTKKINEIQSSVEKMDAILNVLFASYEPYFEDPHSTIAKSFFETLLGHFRNIILPTYRSRHTQFLLFHFAQKSEYFVDTFAGECVDLAFKSGRPVILKQSAAAYLASFVARGAHVSSQTVRLVFDFFGAQLDQIRKDNETTCRGPDLHRYGTFYATTQALLYIFCFRWRDLIILEDDEALDDDDDLQDRDLVWNDGVQALLHRTIFSKLNPLKVCAPSIVKEFARIANHLKFMYVYDRLEKNKRIRLSYNLLAGSALRDSGVGSGATGDDESWYQLDAYFPFDPYQLPTSKKWIENDYVSWKGIPGLIHDDDDDEESVNYGTVGDDDVEEDYTATDDEEED